MPDSHDKKKMFPIDVVCNILILMRHLVTSRTFYLVGSESVCVSLKLKRQLHHSNCHHKSFRFLIFLSAFFTAAPHGVQLTEGWFSLAKNQSLVFERFDSNKINI